MAHMGYVGDPLFPAPLTHPEVGNLASRMYDHFVQDSTQTLNLHFSVSTARDVDDQRTAKVPKAPWDLCKTLLHCSRMRVQLTCGWQGMEECILIAALI